MTLCHGCGGQGCWYCELEEEPDMTSVTIPMGQTTREQMADWVRFAWHVNEIESGLILKPLDLGSGFEDYEEVRIDLNQPNGTARFTAKSERACRALTEAARTWRA